MELAAATVWLLKISVLVYVKVALLSIDSVLRIYFHFCQFLTKEPEPVTFNTTYQLLNKEYQFLNKEYI